MFDGLDATHVPATIALRSVQASCEKIARFVSSWPNGDEAGPLFLAPSMAGLPPGRASALSLLPVRDANGELFRTIEDRVWSGPGLCAAVFAVDPFFLPRDIFRRLAEAGIREVANWPSVGLYGSPFQRQLADKHLDYEREVLFIEEAIKEGCEPTAVAFSAKHAVRMIEAGAKRLLLHPPLLDGALMAAEPAVAWATEIVDEIRHRAEVLVYTEDSQCDQVAGRSIDGFALYSCGCAGLPAAATQRANVWRAAEEAAIARAPVGLGR
jgi:predicted TIM-barrel enzyme